MVIDKVLLLSDWSGGGAQANTNVLSLFVVTDFFWPAEISCLTVDMVNVSFFPE